MAKYESLPVLPIASQSIHWEKYQLPELVHLEDSAFSVMIDFTRNSPHVISPEVSMDQAIREMEISGAHLLLVINQNGGFEGVLTSENVWGEKPIQIIQARRIHRDQVTVKMLMVPLSEMIAINFDLLKNACVGHIVKTLSEHHKHYAIVLRANEKTKTNCLQGVFTRAQLSKQLHTDLA